MPVQNSNLKISARPDLATYLPTTFSSLVCQNGQFTLQLSPRRWFVRKIFGYYYLLVLGRSSIIIDNQSFTSLILINRLQNWQSIIIGKNDT